MTTRRGTAKSPRESSTRNRARPRRTWNCTVRPRGAGLPTQPHFVRPRLAHVCGEKSLTTDFACQLACLRRAQPRQVGHSRGTRCSHPAMGRTAIPAEAFMNNAGKLYRTQSCVGRHRKGVGTEKGSGVFFGCLAEILRGVFEKRLPTPFLPTTKSRRTEDRALRNRTTLDSQATWSVTWQALA